MTFGFDQDVICSYICLVRVHYRMEVVSPDIYTSVVKANQNKDVWLVHVRTHD